MKFIDLDTQYRKLKPGIDARIQAVLDQGEYIMGPQVAEFEEKLADYVGVKHAISCANGTDALQLVLMASGVKDGDAVFCPTFTFFATAEAISFVGARPCFVDSDETTFNMSPQSLVQQIQKQIESGLHTPKAIIAVDLFGQPANYPELEEIAKRFDLVLIEDSAQGLGGEISGRKAGSFGDAATTSFFPAKPLGCYGDGGAVFTNDDEYATLVKSLRVHGKGKDKYDNVRIGMNSRLDTIQAAILLEKLAVFPSEVALRNTVAGQYSTKLSDSIKVPIVPEGYLSSWAQYTLTSPDRTLLMAKLKTLGIPSAIYYATCMHQQSAFEDLGYQVGDFPIAERLSNEVFSIPMHPYLQKEDIDQIVSGLL